MISAHDNTIYQTKPKIRPNCTFSYPKYPLNSFFHTIHQCSKQCFFSSLFIPGWFNSSIYIYTDNRTSHRQTAIRLRVESSATAKQRTGSGCAPVARMHCLSSDDFFQIITALNLWFTCVLYVFVILRLRFCVISCRRTTQQSQFHCVLTGSAGLTTRMLLSQRQCWPAYDANYVVDNVCCWHFHCTSKYIANGWFFLAKKKENDRVTVLVVPFVRASSVMIITLWWLTKRQRHYFALMRIKYSLEFDFNDRLCNIINAASVRFQLPPHHLHAIFARAQSHTHTHSRTLITWTAKNDAVLWLLCHLLVARWA